MVQPQFVQLDVFFEAFERGVAGELLQPCDMHALGDAAGDRAAGLDGGPLFDDEGDTVGIDRGGADPEPLRRRFAAGATR